MKKALAETLIYVALLFAIWTLGYAMGEVRASARTREGAISAGRWQGIAEGRGEMMRACLFTMEGKR